MARNKGKRNVLMANSRYQQQGTLREEKSGIKHCKGEIKKSSSSMLRMQHLQNLAAWASGQAHIPSLAALFGHRLAASAESTGIPLDSSLFFCQRCETILQPGSNCTIRIEKNTIKRRRRKNSRIPSQNNVVYTCHFCSNRNIIRGTRTGHMKEISALELRSNKNTKPGSADMEFNVSDNARDGMEKDLPPKAKSMLESKPEKPKQVQEIAEVASITTPVTPSRKMHSTSPENSNNTRLRSNSSSGADSQYSTAKTDKTKSSSHKRKRKGWSSLKEISEGMERENALNIADLKVPFFL